MEENETKIWNQEGDRLYLTYKSVEHDKLENAIYTVSVDSFGRFYLVKGNNEFTFDYKIYGLEKNLIERVLRTYDKTLNGNVGILLNGLKGTGKTVTSKILCNRLSQPVIIVEKKLEDCHFFLNEIPQNITIFIDEYEKIFGNSSEMLTIMDGVLNSTYRRVFILTTNDLRVDENLIQRPSRVRYLKKFIDLSPSVIEEIVDDVLEHKQFKTDCVKFISNLEVMTVDIVKAVINEVNIHCEAPMAFSDVFNVKKLSGKYNIAQKNSNGSLGNFIKDCSVYPRPNFDNNSIGRGFDVNDTCIGIISKVINWTTIEVTPLVDKKGKNIGLPSVTILSMSDADVYHSNYVYSDGFESMLPKSTKDENIGDSILKVMEEYDEDEDETEEVNETQIKKIDV